MPVFQWYEVNAYLREIDQLNEKLQAEDTHIRKKAVTMPYFHNFQSQYNSLHQCL